MGLLDYLLYMAILLLALVGGGKLFYDILMEPMPGYQMEAM